MTREQLVAAIKQNICGKVHRDLVSIEVFPLKNYGALETGVHRFSHPGNRQRPRRCQVRAIVEIRGRTVVADSGDQLRP